jgi:hypothetical protein
MRLVLEFERGSLDISLRDDGKPTFKLDRLEGVGHTVVGGGRESPVAEQDFALSFGGGGVFQKNFHKVGHQGGAECGEFMVEAADDFFRGAQGLWLKQSFSVEQEASGNLVVVAGERVGQRVGDEQVY